LLDDVRDFKDDFQGQVERCVSTSYPLLHHAAAGGSTQLIGDVCSVKREIGTTRVDLKQDMRDLGKELR
jgi:hypothetical protein